jgi:hypothetical protein
VFVSWTTLSLGDVVQWGLYGRRAMMDSCRAVVPSGVVVASMVGLMRGFTLIYHPGDGLAERGGGDLWSLRTRRFLWVDSGGRGTRPCPISLAFVLI